MHWPPTPDEPIGRRAVAAVCQLVRRGRCVTTARDFQEVAIRAIEEGHGSKALWAVASESDPRQEDLMPALAEALEDLGVDRDYQNDAVARYVLERFELVARGELPPYATMHTLWPYFAYSEDPRLKPICDLYWMMTEFDEPSL